MVKNKVVTLLLERMLCLMTMRIVYQIGLIRRQPMFALL